MTKPKFWKIRLFSRQILELRKNESSNSLIFSVTRGLVLCLTFWVILLKFFRSVFENNVNKHYKMAWNCKTDSYIATPWRLKLSESNISIYYKASTVSYSMRKDGWVQQIKYTRNAQLITCSKFFIKCKCMVYIYLFWEFESNVCKSFPGGMW